MAKKVVAKRGDLAMVVRETKMDSAAMQGVFRLSLAEIEKVLAGEARITDVTKVAAGTLANYSRIKSTEIHEKALEIMMAKGITK